MIYVVFKDGSWNETESDLQAAEYASNPDWLVTIKSNASALLAAGNALAERVGKLVDIECQCPAHKADAAALAAWEMVTK
jgi:hypothetical protein